VIGISRTIRTSGYLGMAAVMMILAGCASTAPGQASGRPAAPATARDAVSPPATPSAIPSWRLKVLASRYLAVAQPANRRLDRSNDGFEDAQHDDLTAAAADLRSEASTERWFDQGVSQIPFPPAIAAMVTTLVRVNQSRIELTRREARSASVHQLRTYLPRHRRADEAVEAEVRQIRRALRLPPPSDD
jgi:hypothetical protein